MAESSTSSGNRLGQWFSEVYSIVSDIKSIISVDAATASTSQDTTITSTSAFATASLTSASATASSYFTSIESSSPFPSSTFSSASNPTSQSAASSFSSESAAFPSSSSLSASVAISSASSVSSASEVSSLSSTSPSSIASLSTNSATTTSITPSTITTTPSTSSHPNSVLNSDTTTINQVATSSSAPSASSSASAVASHHGSNNNLTIILSTVLGGLALIALVILLLFCCRRRRSRRTNRVSTPDEDDGDPWRGPDPSQPMMANIAGPERYSHPNDHPLLSQHPAFRGIETGSTNPFVPVIPPPRRTTPSTRPISITQPDASQEPYSSSPTRTGPDPLAYGIAGLASGVAAQKIARKPVNRGSTPEATSPIDRNANRYSMDSYGSPDRTSYIPVGYDPRVDPRSYDEPRDHASQPLMSGDENPGTYTPDRPPTPFGLMGMAGGRAPVAVGNPSNNYRETYGHQRQHSSGDLSSLSRQSYDSTGIYPPTQPVARHQTPPEIPSRSPRRSHYGDIVEMPPSPGRASHQNSSGQSGSASSIPRNGQGSPSGQNRQSPRRQTPSSPSPSSMHTDSADSTWRLSSTMPGAWGASSSSSGIHQHHTPAPNTRQPQGRRLRLQDLQARAEERRRLREGDGWEDQTAFRGRDDREDDQAYGVGRAL